MKGRNMMGKKISLVENSADPPREQEANWIMRWLKGRSIGEYIGEIMEKPELLLDHAAGRIYKVVTDREAYFLIVGCGNPVLYPMKKTLNSPEEILSFHRGRGLVTRLKFNHLQNQKESEIEGEGGTEHNYQQILGKTFPKVRRMLYQFEEIRREIKKFPSHENFILFLIEEMGKGKIDQISKIIEMLDQSSGSLCKFIEAVNCDYYEFMRQPPLPCT
jgi:hypothetical protein